MFLLNSDGTLASFPFFDNYVTWYYCVCHTGLGILRENSRIVQKQAWFYPISTWYWQSNNRR